MDSYELKLIFGFHLERWGIVLDFYGFVDIYLDLEMLDSKLRIMIMKTCAQCGLHMQHVSLNILDGLNYGNGRINKCVQPINNIKLKLTTIKWNCVIQR